MQTKAEADRASNERLVAALFDGVAAEEQADTISKEISSHKQVQLDENGDPVQLRFAFVDEAECIGCTYCADVARGNLPPSYSSRFSVRGSTDGVRRTASCRQRLSKRSDSESRSSKPR